MFNPSAVSTGIQATTPSADPRFPKAAQEFEAMLLQESLKFGSEDGQYGGELDQACQGYEDLRNQAVATAMAQSGGIGIARMLEQHFGGSEDIKVFSSSADTSIAG